MIRTLYYISDGTGISAETLGRSLITQFEQITFQSYTLPYIDTEAKAYAAIAKINQTYAEDHTRPIIFSTIVKPEIRHIIASSQGLVIDFFHSFIGALEEELQMPAQSAVGLSHAVINREKYNTRIDAVDFSLQCDDGINLKAYGMADIILLGASRTGKTPTCLYLAMQYGIRAANFPLTDEDLQNPMLPKVLAPHRNKLFGLIISAERLHQIRMKRLPDSRYASMAQCETELNVIAQMYRLEGVPHLNSTELSIEELSTRILALMDLKR